MIKKNLNLNKVNDVINMCADLRIYTKGYFMLGFPTETKAELQATIDFAVKSKLHSALFFVVIPFKGTELYDLSLEQLKRRNYKYEDYDYFRSPFNLSGVSDTVLFRTQKWAYVRLATNPARIYRLFRDFPDYRLIWPAIKTWIEFFSGAGKGHRPGKPDLVPGASKNVTWY
jgi:radical SAM superfamily enzyme YgiQ (UPF0313 family)